MAIPGEGAAAMPGGGPWPCAGAGRRPCPFREEGPRPAGVRRRLLRLRLGAWRDVCAGVSASARAGRWTATLLQRRGARGGGGGDGLFPEGVEEGCLGSLGGGGGLGAILPRLRLAPSKGGWGAPPGVRAQTGPGRPPRSTTRSILSAPWARSWSRILGGGASLNTKLPSGRSKPTRAGK